MGHLPPDHSQISLLNLHLDAQVRNMSYTMEIHQNSNRSFQLQYFTNRLALDISVSFP